MGKSLLAAGVLLLLIVPACATTPVAPALPETISIQILSTPDHGIVYSSKDEHGPWHVWKKPEDQHITPSNGEVLVGEYYWLKVTKKDYLDGTPQFVRTKRLRNVKLEFDLEMEPKKYAEMMRAKGMVLFKDEWVDPVARGVAKYKGSWVDPDEEGLIGYRGELIKPEDEGLVLRGGKWMTPGEREELRKADAADGGVTAAEPTPSQDKASPGTVAEGLAAIKGNDLAAARKAAIDDALTNALQQRLGLYIKSSRVSENYVLLKYRVESETAGVIDSYEILDEASDEGVFWAKVRVIFREDMIESRNLDKIRVFIAGDEVFVGDNGLFTSTFALQSITNTFAENGFRISPGPDGSWNLRENIFDASVYERYRTHAWAGGADLLVAINAKSQIADEFGGLITFNTNIEGRVVKAQTGEILASRTMNHRGERKTTAPEAAEASLSEAGAAISDYLIGRIVKRYSGLLAHTLSVKNVKSRGQADLIVGELRTLSGVKGASLLEYALATAQIEVELTPEANEVFPESVNRLRDVNLKVIRSLQSDTVARVR